MKPYAIENKINLIIKTNSRRKDGIKEFFHQEEIR
jgi:hypothetical protein